MGTEKGYSMLETLAGMFILVLVGVALLASLTLSSRVLLNTDNRETARDLAVAEMEYVKNLPYADSYNQYVSLIPGGSNYGVTIETSVAVEIDGNLQFIRVIIRRNGTEVTRIEGYKVKWQ
jgi:hypothetical protein